MVVTDGNAPTPANSCELKGRDDLGRGSFVFYNQASMFQGPETGWDSLGEAREAGGSGNSDYGACASQAFTDAGRFFHA
jgi:hypothetical protein